MGKKINKQQLRQIIKEEAEKLNRRTILENEKRALLEELSMMSEYDDEQRHWEKMAAWDERHADEPDYESGYEDEMRAPEYGPEAVIAELQGGMYHEAKPLGFYVSSSSPVLHLDKEGDAWYFEGAFSSPKELRKHVDKKGKEFYIGYRGEDIFRGQLEIIDDETIGLSTVVGAGDDYKATLVKEFDVYEPNSTAVEILKFIKDNSEKFQTDY